MSAETYWRNRADTLQKALENLLAMIDDADYLPSDDEWSVIVAGRAAASVGGPEGEQ